MTRRLGARRSAWALVAGCLALGWVSATPARGQVPDSTGGSLPTPADSARPATRLPDLRVQLRRSAATTYRIERSEAASSGASVGEWVRSLPGVQVRGRGPGGVESLSVRGGRAQDVRVMLDGIPLDDPLTGAADLSLLPAESIEEATLRAGAGHGIGAGGTSGTLELRSRDVDPGVRVGAFAGSFGRRGSEIEAGWSGSGARLGLFARAERARNDYSFENRIHPERARERRINADRDALHFLARGAATGLPLSFLARADYVERGSPGRMGNHVWDDARWRERRVAVGAAWTGGEDSGASLAWTRRSSRFADGRMAPESWMADEISLRGSGAGPLGLTVAWEAAWARIGGDGFGEGYTRRTGAVRLSRHQPLTRHVQADLSLAADAAREGLAWSPTLGLSWTPARAWRAWGRASRARRLPTFADLFLRPGFGARPNPDLTPERVELDAEIGVAWRSSTVTARSVAFWRRTRDPIIWLPSVVSIWSPDNLGRLEAGGVEVSGRWEPVGMVAVEAAGTWQRSRVRFDDEVERALPYEPAWSGSLALIHSTPSRGARIGLDWLGRRSTSVFTPHDLAPYALLNIRARQAFYLVGARAEVEIGLINALSTAYERVELFPEPGRRFELGIRVRPGGAGLPATASRDTVGRRARPEAQSNTSEENP